MSTLDQTILAFDYGAKRIGVACKPAGGKSVEVVTTLENSEQLWPSVRALLRTYQPDLLIVGWPRTLKGTHSDQTTLAERFAEHLAQHSKLPIQLVDESTSSERAQTRLPKGLPIKQQRAIIDQYAAQIILEDYLQ